MNAQLEKLDLNPNHTLGLVLDSAFAKTSPNDEATGHS